MEQMQQPFGVGIAAATQDLKFIVVNASAEFQVFRAFPSRIVHQLVPV